MTDRTLLVSLKLSLLSIVIGDQLELINVVNNQTSSWKAGLNFDPNEYSLEDLRKLTGVRSEIWQNGQKVINTIYHDQKVMGIPSDFDARGHWPYCPSIKNVMDQGSCRASWAIIAAQTMSDRLCIFSQARIVTHISAQDLLTCCGWRCGFGCEGGYPLAAWDYFQWKGVVTGLGYGDTTYCQPYSFKPLPSAEKAPRTPATPKCVPRCLGNRSLDYDQQKYYGVTSYAVSSLSEQIQMEIIRNGPVQASFTVYEDFFTYKSGVYQHLAGDEVGGQSVKILGWGMEGGLPYWLAVNTWGAKWGAKGLFKIRRGVNMCGIEEMVVAGRARPYRHDAPSARYAALKLKLEERYP